MKWSKTSGSAGKRRWVLPGRDQKGIVLIELLVCIAIFGVISVSFLSALVAGYRGVIVAHDQTMAESLTRTTLEDVTKASFPISTTDNVTTVATYQVVVHADYVNKDTYEPLSTGTLSAIQMVTVTVRHANAGKNLKVTNVLKVQS